MANSEKEQKGDRRNSLELIAFPFVSVIVPAYNAEVSLGACLDSISALDYPADKLEVIVVDNDSTDRGREIASRYRVKLFSEISMKSSYAARNKGILAAKGELIAFTDADCVVTPGWLKHLVKKWGDQSIGCFAGEVEAYQPRTLVEKFSDRAGILKQRGALNCPYLPYTSTANSAYRKGIFDKIGLFIPEMFTGGDAEIAWRMQQKLGLKIEFIPEALVYHKHRSSVMGLYRQFKKYEYGKLFLHKYYPEYKLPTLEERKKELDKAIRRAKSTFRDNVKRYCKKEIDCVDLAAPFLRIVIRYGKYKARSEQKMRS